MTELLAREMELLRQLLAGVPWRVEVEVRLPSGEVFRVAIPRTDPAPPPG